MVGFNYLQPFKLSRNPIFGEPVVEENFDGGFFPIIVVVRDEADESTFECELKVFGCVAGADVD
jgi:hypothetical protein